MAEKKIPVRTCVACKKEFEKKRLIRIVMNKDGEIFVDGTGKADGRGAYFCGDAECYSRLVKTKALNRSFKTAVPDEVYESIREEVFGKRE